MVNLALFTSICGMLYSVVYWALGYPSVATISAIYIVLVFISFTYLYYTKKYFTFRNIILTLVLLLPFADQLVIGGFYESSGLILAAFATPICALLMTRKGIARRYFYSYLFLLLVATLVEYFFFHDQASGLPRHVILLFFFLTFSFSNGIIYFITEFFLTKTEELQQNLKKSLNNLRLTQNKLIQSEKMASWAS